MHCHKPRRPVDASCPVGVVDHSRTTQSHPLQQLPLIGRSKKQAQRFWLRNNDYWKQPKQKRLLNNAQRRERKRRVGQGRRCATLKPDVIGRRLQTTMYDERSSKAHSRMLSVKSLLDATWRRGGVRRAKNNFPRRRRVKCINAAATATS